MLEESKSKIKIMIKIEIKNVYFKIASSFGHIPAMPRSGHQEAKPRQLLAALRVILRP
jgi:hypothetical protein